MEGIRKERDASIDILRFIAIMGILIAHSNPNQFLIQIRGFDVALMVFLSAVCAKGFDKENFNYFDFFIKRGIRLILPVWIFFVFYYVGVYVFYYLPPLREVLSSFTLTSDRYVWIIRILVVLAILAPFIWKYANKLSSTSIIITLSIGFLLSECSFEISSSKSFEMVLMTVPYGTVYFLGMNINKFDRKQQLTLAAFFFISFIALFSYYWIESGKFMLTSYYKSPPRFYYMSYALAATLCMWVYRKQLESFIQKIYLLQFAKFVGSHTYWLYLWHIPIVDMVGDKFNPFMRFSLIFGGALICVLIQNVIVKRFVRNKSLIPIFNG